MLFQNTVDGAVAFFIFSMTIESPSFLIPLPASRNTIVPSYSLISGHVVLPPYFKVSLPGTGNEPLQPHIIIRMTVSPPDTKII
ncbi:MAG: hypothetical protein JW969_19430 [Spirochaetales bacterium]|nr:hypothetical protein [Spirochaetales bacterium]